jgi:hypothetical protein
VRASHVRPDVGARLALDDDVRRCGAPLPGASPGTTRRAARSRCPRACA